MKPDYDAIAASIFARNCTPTAIATALRAAYDQGALDGLDREEVNALVAVRVGRYAEKTNRVAAQIEHFVGELRAAKVEDR